MGGYISNSHTSERRANINGRTSFQFKPPNPHPIAGIAIIFGGLHLSCTAKFFSPLSMSSSFDLFLQWFFVGKLTILMSPTVCTYGFPNCISFDLHFSIYSSYIDGYRFLNFNAKPAPITPTQFTGLINISAFELNIYSTISFIYITSYLTSQAGRDFFSDSSSSSSISLNERSNSDRFDIELKLFGMVDI